MLIISFVNYNNYTFFLNFSILACRVSKATTEGYSYLMKSCFNYRFYRFHR